MGVCASCHNSKKTTTRTRGGGSGKGGGGGGAGASESFRRPSTIMVVDMANGGEIKEYKQPIPASLVVSENPNCYLSNAESMCIGTCMPRVPDEEQLLPGRIYFLVPLSHSQFPLSLPLLCDLAVKASSALPNADPQTLTNSASIDWGCPPENSEMQQPILFRNPPGLLIVRSENPHFIKYSPICKLF